MWLRQVPAAPGKAVSARLDCVRSQRSVAAMDRVTRVLVPMVLPATIVVTSSKFLATTLNAAVSTCSAGVVTVYSVPFFAGLVS